MQCAPGTLGVLGVLSVLRRSRAVGEETCPGPRSAAGPGGGLWLPAATRARYLVSTWSRASVGGRLLVDWSLFQLASCLQGHDMKQIGLSSLGLMRTIPSGIAGQHCCACWGFVCGPFNRRLHSLQGASATRRMLRKWTWRLEIANALANPYLPSRAPPMEGDGWRSCRILADVAEMTILTAWAVLDNFAAHITQPSALA